MNFDESKVYTALDADSLHKGDLVFGADRLQWLKTVVKSAEEKYPGVITGILTEDNEYRFTVSGDSNYQLVYLICRADNAEAYKAWKYGESVEIETDTGWVDVDSDELEENPDDWLYRNLRVKDFRQSKEHYRPYKSVEELVLDFKKRFDTHTPAYAMPLMWVKKKDVDKTYLITGFGSAEEGKFVSIGIVYNSLGVLFEDYTFLDGSPCGVKE